MRQWKSLIYILICLIALEPLEALATVQGTVRDKNTQAAIAGATVKAFRNNKLRGTATTQADGSYSMDLQPGNNYNIVATATNYQSKAIGAKLKNGNTKTINFNLLPTGGTIDGNVQSELGGPINNATIQVFQGPFLIATTTTDINGDYNVPNIAKGFYFIVASATSHRTAYKGTFVKQGQISTVDFNLSSTSGTLQGKVIDLATTDPIEGAFIEAISKGVVISSSTETDANGDYSITGLAPGMYSVNAMAENYEEEIKGAKISVGQTTTLNFELEQNPGEIQGTVTDALTTDPIQGAKIRIFQGTSLIATTLTDEAGFYSVDTLAPDSYTVSVIATDYQDKIEGAVVSAGEITVVNFALNPQPGTVEGTVTDKASANPIAGAKIIIYQGTNIVASTITDEVGFYSVETLAPGSYLITANSSGYQEKIEGVLVSANTTTTVDFKLVANPGILNGTVTIFGTQDPIVGAEVRVFKGSNLIASVLTDNTGFYSIDTLAPGNYKVVALARNYQKKVMGAKIVNGETTTTNFALKTNPGSLKGTVTDKDTSNPISSATLKIFKGSTLIATSLTNAAGFYQINKLPPSTYTAVASKFGYQDRMRGAKIKAGEVNTLNFKLNPNPGSINGTITDKDTTDPIPGAEVEIYQGINLIASAITDSLGFYSIDTLAPGSYIVLGTADGYQEKAVGATVEAGDTTTVNLALSSSPGTLNGTVTDAETLSAVSGAEIQVFQGTTLIATTLTNNVGFYEISTLAPEKYIVSATADGYQEKMQSITIIADQISTLDFALSSNPGTLEGTVIDADTQNPIAGTSIDIFKGATIIANGITDDEGFYSVNSLPTGSYILVATAAGYQQKITGAIITSNETTTVDFVLETRPGTIGGNVNDAVTTNPIEGAEIRIFKRANLIASTLTDLNGDYLVNFLSPDTYFELATAESYQGSARSATVDPNETTEVNFSLESTPGPGAIEGIITDNLTQEPLSSVLVQVYKDTTLIDTTFSGAGGSYNISLLEPDTYIVTAIIEDYQQEFATAIVTADNTTIVNFALDASPGTIYGKVTDERTTEPLPGTSIEIFSDGNLIRAELTDSEGNYLVSSLAAGDYTVTAINDNFSPESKTATVLQNQLTQLNFQLGEGPAPVRDLSAEIIYNELVTILDITHRLRWKTSTSPNIESYRIYRNGLHIYSLSAKAPLLYDDHGRNGKIDTYTVEAVNEFGSVSASKSIVIGK
ncbi:MAG: hypothetical protein S4CHLAM6_03670 [Chlamydiae bacterium]|nr:hypothetical protein [Chlamydiota bacterium]